MSDETIVAETETADMGKTDAPSQKPVRSEKETTAFNLKKQAEKLRELGGDPAETLGIKTNISIDESLADDKPLTVKDLRDIQKQDARKTAEQMAEEIKDEDEREAVKSELAWIVPSGNPQEDFRRAQAAANAPRNAKIAEDAQRRTTPRRTASGSSQSAPVEDEFVPTEAEAVFMRPPYKLSKEKIIAQRQKEQK